MAKRSKRKSLSGLPASKKRRGRPRAKSLPPNSQIELEDQEWEVEAIVGRRVKLNPSSDAAGRGIVEFLVKWKGYPEEENTWEPETNLSNSMELLCQYLCKNPA